MAEQTAQRPQGKQALQGEIQEAIGRLDPANSEHWTSDGKPQVVVLEGVLGYDITSAERDAAWRGLRDEGRSAEKTSDDEPVVRDVISVRIPNLRDRKRDQLATYLRSRTGCEADMAAGAGAPIHLIVAADADTEEVQGQVEQILSTRGFIKPAQYVSIKQREVKR